MPYASVNGIELYYESHGEGPAILFAHGAGGNHLSWWQQVPYFSGQYRCITFDHRAFGMSGDTTGAGRSSFAQDAIALLDHLGLERVFVVAHSMGGRTAAGLVRNAGNRLRALVLSGTLGGAVDEQTEAIMREFRDRYRAALHCSIAHWASDRARSTGPRVPVLLNLQAQSAPPEGLSGSTPRLSRLNCLALHRQRHSDPVSGSRTRSNCSACCDGSCSRARRRVALRACP